MTIVHVILQPCPWCKKTPDLIMLTSDTTNTKGTWTWKIRCDNRMCNVNPESKYVPIRNKIKGNCFSIAEKLGKLADYWNEGNDYAAYEMKVVDLISIEEKYGQANQKD